MYRDLESLCNDAMCNDLWSQQRLVAFVGTQAAAVITDQSVIEGGESLTQEGCQVTARSTRGCVQTSL